MTAAAAAGQDRLERYQYRYGIPDGVSIGALSDEPEMLAFDIVEEPQFADARISSLIEYHGVYPLAAEELVAAITSYEDYPRISRRVVESDVRPPREPLPYGPIGSVSDHHEAFVRTSFEFLFFGRGYAYVLSSMTEELKGGSFLVRG